MGKSSTAGVWNMVACDWRKPNTSRTAEGKPATEKVGGGASLDKAILDEVAKEKDPEGFYFNGLE